MAEVVQIADRCVVMAVTIARFKRPANPRRCNIKRYHVWRWRGGADGDDVSMRPARRSTGAPRG